MAEDPGSEGGQFVTGFRSDEGLQMPESAPAVVLVSEDGVGRWEGPWEIQTQANEDGSVSVSLRRIEASDG